MSESTEKKEDNTAIDSFESAMAELNRLVIRLEEGELPLEASVSAYRRGVELVRYCTAQLEKVDRQIEVLDKEMLRPFQQDDVSESR